MSWRLSCYDIHHFLKSQHTHFNFGHSCMLLPLSFLFIISKKANMPEKYARSAPPVVNYFIVHSGAVH